MCSRCAHLGYKLKHDSFVCPYISSLYCGICASYGHTSYSCTDSEVLEQREPQFVEQLIPPSLRDALGIQTKTPLPKVPSELKAKYEPVLEVHDTDRNIRALLMNYNKPISGKAKENRLRLQKLADELGRKLVYLKPVS